MDGLLSFLFFGVFFYAMMRFGCGAHMVHGDHGGHGSGGHKEHSGQENFAKDPVCGMDVASGEGYSKMYDGRSYRLCSRKCLDKFEAEPQRYLS